MKGKITYVLATIIIVYAIIARGYGANDWNTGSILIAIALMAVALQIGLHDKKNE